MKHSYLLILLGYFNTSLECKVICLEETSDYITKDYFDGAQVILL